MGPRKGTVVYCQLCFSKHSWPSFGHHSDIQLFHTVEPHYNRDLDTMKIDLFYQIFCYTVEPRYNEDLGTMKITLLYQVSPYIRVKNKEI